LKHFLFYWISLLFLKKTDLCFDVFVLFFYHKKQLKDIFVKNKDEGKKRIKKSLKWETYSQGRTLEENSSTPATLCID